MAFDDIVIDKITSMRGWQPRCKTCGEKILEYPQDGVCPHCGAEVVSWEYIEPAQLSSLSCPFCGGSVNILPCDDEGNLKSKEYEQNPYSGLGYVLNHSIFDVPYGKFCPIATLDEDGMLGGLIYTSRENAISAWKGDIKNGNWLY